MRTLCLLSLLFVVNREYVACHVPFCSNLTICRHHRHRHHHHNRHLFVQHSTIAYKNNEKMNKKCSTGINVDFREQPPTAV